jgi:hypothetical protein
MRVARIEHRDALCPNNTVRKRRREQARRDRGIVRIRDQKKAHNILIDASGHAFDLVTVVESLGVRSVPSRAMTPMSAPGRRRHCGVLGVFGDGGEHHRVADACAVGEAWRHAIDLAERDQVDGRGRSSFRSQHRRECR